MSDYEKKVEGFMETLKKDSELVGDDPSDQAAYLFRRILWSPILAEREASRRVLKELGFTPAVYTGDPDQLKKTFWPWLWQRLRDLFTFKGVGM